MANLSALTSAKKLEVANAFSAISESLFYARQNVRHKGLGGAAWDSIGDIGNAYAHLGDELIAGMTQGMGESQEAIKIAMAALPSLNREKSTAKLSLEQARQGVAHREKVDTHTLLSQIAALLSQSGNPENTKNIGVLKEALGVGELKEQPELVSLSSALASVGTREMD